jgi:ATP adenylyltransferase
MSETLWAPWRISYLKSLSQPEPGGCFLCEASGVRKDAQQWPARYLLMNDDRGTLMMNRYPYTNGHLLVGPHRHLAQLDELTADERHGLMDLADLGVRLLSAAMNIHGANLGMNIGRCAGAGVPGHLHLHVVPRWHGDVNFLETVAGARVIPQALDDAYATLRDALPKVAGA